MFSATARIRIASVFGEPRHNMRRACRNSATCRAFTRATLSTTAFVHSSSMALMSEWIKPRDHGFPSGCSGVGRSVLTHGGSMRGNACSISVMVKPRASKSPTLERRRRINASLRVRARGMSYLGGQDH